MMKYLSYLILALTISGYCVAGLPPTTSKVSGDSANVVTFNYLFPNFAGTHTGSTLSLGMLSIAGGGTGQVTAQAAIDALLPSQGGNSGKVLGTNGTTSSWVSSGAPSVTGNMVYVEFGTGHGSTNTKIRTFGHLADNSGSTYITYVSNATNGDSFTIATGGAGLYMVCYGDWRSGAVAQAAITVNDSAMTTNASTPLTFAQGKRMIFVSTSNSLQTGGCWAGDLADADIVRAHDDGANSATDGRSYFSIVRLGSTASEFYVENGNGTGSTNTKVRRFSNSRISTGSDFTYADSSTLGGTVTINSTGTYFFCQMDKTSSAGLLQGMSVNDSALSTDSSSMTYAQGIRSLGVNASVANMSLGSCFVAPLAINDVVRVKTDAAANSTTPDSYWFGVKVSSFTSNNVYLGGGAGHGGLNTKYRTFSNLYASTLSEAIVSQSAPMGHEFLIQTTGTYIACYADRSTASTDVTAIVVGGRVPTSSASTPIDFATGMRGFDASSTNNSGSNTCMAQYITAGTFVSPQDDGSNSKTDTSSYFMIGRVN